MTNYNINNIKIYLILFNFIFQRLQLNQLIEQPNKKFKYVFIKSN